MWRHRAFSLRTALRPRVASWLLVLATALDAAPDAFAQGDPPPAPSAVTPPKLVSSVAPVYPKEAVAAQLSATVTLKLTVSKTGDVTAAEVVTSAGQAFDEAALAAVKQFRFEPATRDGAPVAARILYRVDLKPPGKETAPPPAPVQAPTTSATSKDPPAGMAGAPPQAAANGASTAPASTSPQEVSKTDPAPVQPVDVSVVGKTSEAQALRQSAAPVTVIDTHHAKQQARDLGDVLAGAEGVSVRRSGGLGSFTRFSLNGLYDNQIRFFIDGVPLDIAGSPFGIANVPVNTIDRVEIYRGVLPVRFGADALGGAVNLVTQKLTDASVYASYQRGSFGTHRAAVFGKYHHEPTGFVAGVAGFVDRSKNNYPIDVEVADKTGKISTVTVERSHDHYLSYGGTAQVGIVGKSWAERLTLQLFGITYEKEVPHDAIMTRPIGEAEYGATSLGGTLRYEQSVTKDIHLGAIASGSHQTIRFTDLSEWIYDWYGKRVAKRNRPGELLREPHDATIWQDTGFGRVDLEWKIRPEHIVRMGSTGRFTGRTGEEKATTGQGGIDPLKGARNIFTLITGLEYELNAFDMRPAKDRTTSPYDPASDNRLQNLFAVKHYYYQANAKDVLIGLDVQSLSADGHRLGIGDSVRFRVSPAFSVKASYELATRIPSVEELFGDSLYVNPNVELSPETSHNVNAGAQLELKRTPAGNFVITVDGFLRDVQGLIASITEATGVQFKNVEGARIYGAEAAAKWISPGNWVVLEGNGTVQDARNVSSEGAFQAYDGERIPNRPWAFANWALRVQWRKLLAQDDGLAPFYFGRYVHEFFRNWESIGDRDFKAIVPTQVSHTLGLTYWNTGRAKTTVTFEVDNLTDELLFDFFGVQKPGRAFSVKVTGEL